MFGNQSIKKLILSSRLVPILSFSIRNPVVSRPYAIFRPTIGINLPYKIRYSSSGTDSTEAKSGDNQNRGSNDKIPNDNIQVDENADLVTKIAKLETDLKDLQDKLLRCYAEEENVRRIAKRDVENAKLYANTSFAKSLLEVADNLERAVGAVSDAIKANEDPTLKILLEGVDMTNKGLTKVFHQFGISKYGAIGDSFEPSLHDALYKIPSAGTIGGDGMELKENTIGQVLKTGYKLKDRVIRAAEVGIIVKP